MALNNSKNALTLAALGIVLGDIGTSPLYAIREAFHGSHSIPATASNVFGVLSLIIWALLLIISVKYLFFVLKADNKGEGGVLALTALAVPPPILSKWPWSRALLYLGLFGSALLFGDGAITPAISILSAVEGLKVATPLFEPYVIPITIGILVALFALQRHGTARIGAIFGPIIFVWFSVIGALGIYGILQNPSVLQALSPIYAINYFVENGFNGFAVLGAVFLVVTGGEALYADMGHFGIKPIQRAWFFVALPGLLLNYFGQGALILTTPAAVENPFYLLAPDWALYFLVTLATMAAIIASQALISGVFSLTRQAVQLGYFPRVRIIHTSSHEIGQIYIPPINWALFILTVWLVLTFKSSSSLASAYGIAISLTMVIVTILVSLVAFRKWRWGLPAIAAFFAVFMTVDLFFLAANLTKVVDGGWFPLVVASVIFTLMTTWKKGRRILSARLELKSIPMDQFLEKIEVEPISKTAGVAIFMSSSAEGAPPALLHNVKHNKVLHTRNVIITVAYEEVPHIAQFERVEILNLGKDFFRVRCRYGFMDTPDIQDILTCCEQKGLHIALNDSTFFLGRETIIPSAQPGMAIWREHLFSFMSKNAIRATAYFNIPPEQVMEVGIQVEM